MPEKPQQNLINRVPESTRQKAIDNFRLECIPIIDELKDAGFDVKNLDELRRSRIRYTTAVPILLKWLPLSKDPAVKESIVRTLSVPWSRPIALRPLIAEFRGDSATHGLRWTIGNAIAVIADDSVFEDICYLVQDKQYGKAREMLTVALGKMKNPAAVTFLLDLLNDDEVAGHAIIALGDLKAEKALLKIESFLNHPKSWVRKEVYKALKKIKPSKRV
jgi:HEAT repeat protein